MRLICPIWVVLMLAALRTCAETQAQTASSRFEAGVQGSLLQLSTPSINGVLTPPDRPHYETIFGLGGHADWNVSQYLAIEGEVDWYPRHLSPSFQEEGGRTLQIVMGNRRCRFIAESAGGFSGPCGRAWCASAKSTL
jgi:hypothetical protein